MINTHQQREAAGLPRPIHSSLSGKDSSLLQVDDLFAGYQNRPVLHDVSLTIRSRERVALIGPNGCGKTTLLKVIAGALRPSSGRLLIKGEDHSHTNGYARICDGMGYLMQERNTFPSLSVEENLHLSFWRGKGDFATRRDWVTTMFSALRGRLRQRAGLLSGGERQALAIGMVLMRPVDLLLLDEPTAGLAPKAAATILEAVHQAQEESQFTSIMVEHNLRLIQPWVSRVVVMQQGRVVTDRDDPTILLDPEQLQKFYFE